MATLPRATPSLVSHIDTTVEVNYYRNGGILPTALRKLAGAQTA